MIKRNKIFTLLDKLTKNSTTSTVLFQTSILITKKNICEKNRKNSKIFNLKNFCKLGRLGLMPQSKTENYL